MDKPTFDKYMDLKFYLEDNLGHRSISSWPTLSSHASSLSSAAKWSVRDFRLYLDDMLEAIERIQSYVQDMDMETFSRDRKTQDAVIRNLEIIGEAAGKLPAAVLENAPHIEWRKIKALRNILAHEYFGISPVILWDVVQTNWSRWSPPAGSCQLEPHRRIEINHTALPLAPRAGVQPTVVQKQPVDGVMGIPALVLTRAEVREVCEAEARQQATSQT